MPPRTPGIAGRIQGHQPVARRSKPTLRLLCRSTSLLPWAFGILSIPSGHQQTTVGSPRIALTESAQCSDFTKQLNNPVSVAADKLRDLADVAGKSAVLRVRHSAESELIPTVGAALEPLQHLFIGEAMSRPVLTQGPADKERIAPRVIHQAAPRSFVATFAACDGFLAH